MTDITEEAALDALFRLHEGLPRQGPGTDGVTRAMLDRLRPYLSPAPRVADMGCGSGASTLALAEALPEATIVGIDIHPAFVESLTAEAERRGLSGRVSGRVGDMGALPDPDAAYDLIWAEGSAYLLTFEGALAAWRPLLPAGGVMALSEISWLTDAPSAEAIRYWKSVYPPIGGIVENRARAAAAGFDVLFAEPLPQVAWTEGYYAPLEARIDALRRQGGLTEAMEAAIAETDQEIALYRAHGREYGYVFYGLRKR